MAYRPFLPAAFAALTIAAALPSAGAAEPASMVKRGEYLVTIMDCSGCHTPGALAGQPDASRELAGSDIGFEIPGLGVFYPPNLTPDRETGLGKWSRNDIAIALTTGRRPDGRELAPIMPWRSYARLTRADAAAISAYLKSLKPVDHKAPGMVAADRAATAPFLRVIVPSE